MNTPRYATLPNIMKAKKKPLAVWKKDKELAGLDLDPRLEVLEVSEPAKREGGKKVESVDEVGLTGGGGVMVLGSLMVRSFFSLRS